MSNSKRLRKVDLGPDWIDLSYGEPKVIMQSLMAQLTRVGSKFTMPTIQDVKTWEYPPACGRKDLCSLLEEKYDAKVIVCNGAKQALAASLNAFSKAGLKNIYYDIPYYPSNPDFIADAGLQFSDIESADSFLITSPNNPDGKNYSNVEIMEFCRKGPTIHDAAYYTDVYLPDEQIPIPSSDIQIYSVSKMYGLSGLRVGYAVVHNEKYYDDIVNFIEYNTAGVSAASQTIVHNIELFFKNNRDFFKEFQHDARKAIAESRLALQDLDPDVLQLLPCSSNSMFAWCKAGPLLDANSAKVYLLDGTMFGQPGMVRINIAHPLKTIQEAVKRLNDNKVKV